MPIYDYKCDIHGTFEMQQSIKEPPLDNCPKCVKEQKVVYHCDACNLTLRLSLNEAKILYYDSESNLIKCTKCGTDLAPSKPKKLISLSSFVLVGGGWAKDNYK